MSITGDSNSAPAVIVWKVLWRAGLAAKRGQVEKEEKLLRQALWLAQKEATAPPLEVGILLLDLADCLDIQDNQEAEEFYKQAHDILVAYLRQSY